jgi:ribosomal protein S18 acetylase RimI-like enzyme
MIGLLNTSKHELDEIAAMAKIIWHHHYINIIGEAQVQYMLNKFYNHDALIKQVNEGQVFCFIQDKDKRIGFIAYTLQSDQICFINKYYILPEYQGKSIGSVSLNLLEKTINQNLKTTFKYFKLTVNRQNFKSINFYFKNGFTIESVADFDIGNGYHMNDFIMKKLIKAE